MADEQPPPLQAPEGYEFVDGKLVKTQAVAADVNCPPGTKLVDGECVPIDS